MSKIIGLMLICVIVSPVVFASDSDPAPKPHAAPLVVSPPPPNRAPPVALSDAEIEENAAKARALGLTPPGTPTPTSQQRGLGFPSLESKQQRDPNKQDMQMATSVRHVRPSGRLGGYAVAGGGIVAAICALMEEHPVWSALALFVAIGCGVAWIRWFFTRKVKTQNPAVPEKAGEWFIERPAGREGPFFVAEIGERLSKGTITADTMAVSLNGRSRLAVAALVAVADPVTGDAASPPSAPSLQPSMSQESPIGVIRSLAIKFTYFVLLIVAVVGAMWLLTLAIR
jgi:hypothetical protein